MQLATNIIAFPMPKPFEEFWAIYPHKVAKLAAQRAWKNLPVDVTMEQILSGLERYKKFKPESQSFCHAATWLNGERWDDVWRVESKPQIKLPTEIDVLTYCREKGGTDKDWQFAKDWHRKWQARNYRDNGRVIDWKIRFGEDFAKQRA